MSITAGPGNEIHRDSQQLEREADAIRADLDRTLNALERKLSPRWLVDRSLNFVQANGGEVLQKIGVTVNKHPLSILLASAGLVWLVASRRSSKHRHRSYAARPSAAPRSGDFDPASQSFGSSLHDRTHDLKQRAYRTLDATRARASRSWESTRDRTRGVGRDVNGLIREQPLVCGAVAVAVGAIVGAALPASSYERDLITRARETGDGVLDDMASNTQREEPLAGSSAPPTSH